MHDHRDITSMGCHLFLLGDARMLKQVLYAEFVQGKTPQCKPRKRSRLTFKETLQKVNVETNTCEHLVSSRSEIGWLLVLKNLRIEFLSLG